MSLTHVTRGDWKCSACPRTFRNQAQLHVHVLGSHSEGSPARYPHRAPFNVDGERTSARPPPPPSPPSTPYVFVSYSDTVNTPRTKASQAASRHICPECSKCFTRASTLRDHIHAHWNVRQFACDVCPRTFVRRHDLNVHARTHTGQRDRGCGGQLANGAAWGCGRRFNRAFNLHRHYQSASGAKCLRSLDANLTGNEDLHTILTRIAQLSRASSAEPATNTSSGRSHADDGLEIPRLHIEPPSPQSEPVSSQRNAPMEEFDDFVDLSDFEDANETFEPPHS